jgi:hypothetical protein
VPRRGKARRFVVAGSEAERTPEVGWVTLTNFGRSRWEAKDQW